ncbi:hypothetical protein AB0K15_47730, partial [Amycolatopsis sp. NPDC049253]|uniref:hypothetical protein n=1 Tax=Amycolatopsis sp. NPDC049253 TaxID=3155274 RepID=UPI0034303889
MLRPIEGSGIHAVEQQATLDEALLNAGGAQRAWAMLTVDELGAAVVPFDRLGDQRVQPLLLIRGELLWGVSRFLDGPRWVASGRARGEVITVGLDRGA